MIASVFRGLGVALVTPFLPDGSIDYKSLDRLVDHQLAGGVDFMVVHGTTGESPCLTRQEREDVIHRIIARVGGQVPIVIGLGGNDTLELGARMRALDIMGISGVLSVVPYYNKPTQEGLYQHFSYLSGCTQLPIILYNVPGRVGVNMMPDTVARLANEHANIVGLKEASGFVAQAEQVLRLVNRSDFTVLSGDDNISIDFIRNGALGVISVIGNAYPELFGRLIHLSLEGRYNEADMIQEIFRDMNVHLFANGNPSGIKSLLYQIGIIDHNVLRLPLVPTSPEVHRAIGVANQLIQSLRNNF